MLFTGEDFNKIALIESGEKVGIIVLNSPIDW